MGSLGGCEVVVTMKPQSRTSASRRLKPSSDVLTVLATGIAGLFISSKFNILRDGTFIKLPTVSALQLRVQRKSDS